MTERGCNARAATTYGVSIAACAHAYPSAVVDNPEFFRRAEYDPAPDHEKLIRETRMKTRRWCLPHENTRTLAEDAVDRLFARAPELRDGIDLVIVASGTTLPIAQPTDPDNPAFADLAPLIARRLGRERALSLDIKACYCTGFLRALEVADRLLADENRHSALVVAVEQGSRFATSPNNRSSFCFIVGDAAGAVVLQRTPQRDAGVLDHTGYTDVAKLDWVGIGADAASIIMKGSRAAEATHDMLVECANTLLVRNGLTPRQIDHLLPIQTHAGLLEGVVSSLDWPRDKVLWLGDVNGFSGSASIPSCLSEMVERGAVRRGELLLSIAVGAGMNCAGALYRF